MGRSSEAAEGGRYLADGTIYSPATDSWAPDVRGSVAGRPRHFRQRVDGEADAGVGGYGRSDSCTPCLFGDGAAYDPSTDAWTPMAPSPLSGRGGARAVWTGRGMLVWGGFDGAVQVDGALYNPSDDSWSRLVAGPLAARQLQAMVWTGQQLVIWGGTGLPNEGLADGAVLTLSAF